MRSNAVTSSIGNPHTRKRPGCLPIRRWEPRALSRGICHYSGRRTTDIVQVLPTRSSQSSQHSTWRCALLGRTAASAASYSPSSGVKRDGGCTLTLIFTRDLSQVRTLRRHDGFDVKYEKFRAPPGRKGASTGKGLGLDTRAAPRCAVRK